MIKKRSFQIKFLICKVSHKSAIEIHVKLTANCVE